jgi:hypothetical protein
MAVTTTWSINTLERKLSDGIVSTVHFGTASVDNDDASFAASSYGSVGLAAPADGDDVIPYADLTADTCIGWVKGALGADAVTAIETALSDRIELQKNPVTGSGVPW